MGRNWSTASKNRLQVCAVVIIITHYNVQSGNDILSHDTRKGKWTEVCVNQTQKNVVVLVKT